jgi:hypothetical protein
MRETCFSPLKPPAALLGLLLVVLAAPVAQGDEPRLSLSGYDPVAYFIDRKPVQGKAEFEHVWHRLRWRFANNDHRDLFMKKSGSLRAAIRRLLRDGRVGR